MTTDGASGTDFRIIFKTSGSCLKDRKFYVLQYKQKGAFSRLVIYIVETNLIILEKIILSRPILSPCFYTLQMRLYICVIHKCKVLFVYSSIVQLNYSVSHMCHLKFFALLITKGKKKEEKLILVLFNPVYLKCYFNI